MANVRRVATPAGAKYYNAPIGTPISAARVAVKVKEGVSAASSATEVGRRKGRGGNDRSSYFSRKELKGFADETLEAMPGRLMHKMPRNADLKQRQALQGVLDMISEELHERTGKQRSWTVTAKGASMRTIERPQIVDDAISKRDVSSGEREKLSSKGKALPDGSFPIASKSDLSNAIQAFGRTNDKAKTKRHIIRRARELGATDMLPSTWSVSKVSSRVYPDLERSPGDDDNWVESSGGLPSYIERIAKHLHYERGYPIGRAIATAVSRCRRWARGGGNVKADTQAKAAKAIAEWEAKKARSKAKTAAGAAAGAARGARRRDKIGKDDSDGLLAECEIVKADDDRQIVFGWAYVSHDEEGGVNVDKSGEFVSNPDELESAAYNFVLKSRNGDLNHDSVVKSTMVESMVFTEDKMDELGIEKGTMPTGWWVGFRVGDKDTWADVKSGKYTAFSIHGTGARKAVA